MILLRHRYEIWIGYYHSGQGSTPPKKPALVDVIWASSFENACYIHECKIKYETAIRQDSMKRKIDNQSKEWFYNYEENKNSWTGKYYESREEALESFK